MTRLALILFISVLAGCASDVAVKVRLHEPQSGTPLAQVKVNDLRTPGVAASKREAAFGVPMGNITFDPPETQLVKSFLEAEITKILRERRVQSQQEYVCDLVEFGVNTDTTPLYWDVVGRVRLVLKRGGKEYRLFGTNTQRTYAWPGETIISKTVNESLAQIAAELRRVAEGI